MALSVVGWRQKPLVRIMDPWARKTKIHLLRVMSDGTKQPRCGVKLKFYSEGRTSFAHIETMRGRGSLCARCFTPGKMKSLEARCREGGGCSE